MNQSTQFYEYGQAQPQVIQTLITAQSLQAIMSVIMLIWMGTFVVQQVVKVVKGKEVEKPPIIP